MKRVVLAALTAVVLVGCGRRGAVPLSYDPPGSTITTSKPITAPVRSDWAMGSIGVTNDYDGARLNRLTAANDSSCPPWGGCEFHTTVPDSGRSLPLSKGRSDEPTRIEPCDCQSDRRNGP